MGLSKATKVWLDGVAEGNDHAALCAACVFIALESDGKPGNTAFMWLAGQATQRKYPMVRRYASEVLGELEALRSEK
jgi:hypothetical protein